MMELQGNWLLAAVTTLTSMGFLLIGFDNGLMGGLITAKPWNITFNSPDANMKSVMVSFFEIGCFVGSVVTAFVGEKQGRRKSIAGGVLVMIIGTLLQCTSFSRSQFIIARVVSGIGLGAINSTVPVLQAEFAPKASRGIYVCMQLTTLNFGVALVYWIDYAFSSHSGSYAWRVPVILQCVFLIPMLFILYIIPETPRWLASHDRPEDAHAVLKRLKGNSMDEASIDRLHQDILQTVALEASLGAGTWKDLLKNDQIQSQRRLIIACAIQIFQQLSGINAVIYYSSTLFQSSVGFDGHMSALMSGFLQTWFFAASFIPWLLIDRIGRRPLLLSMVSVMAAAMAAQAALVYQIQHKTAISHTSGIAAAVMLFIFEGAFTIGFQATVWVYPAEILPLRLRQRGSSISTAANWICNYAVTQFTPPALENIGWRTYIIFAVLNALWVPIMYLLFPETKGMELEDVDRLFSGESIERVVSNSKVAAEAIENVAA